MTQRVNSFRKFVFCFRHTSARLLCLSHNLVAARIDYDNKKMMSTSYHKLIFCRTSIFRLRWQEVKANVSQITNFKYSLLTGRSTIKPSKRYFFCGRAEAETSHTKCLVFAAKITVTIVAKWTLASGNLDESRRWNRLDRGQLGLENVSTVG